MSANLYYKLSQLRKKQREREKYEWLDKKIKYSEGSADENLKYIDVIHEYLVDITVLLEKKNYKIRDEKQFKDEIISYIYSESN